jgi:hypothetical protein
MDDSLLRAMHLSTACRIGASSGRYDLSDKCIDQIHGLLEVDQQSVERDFIQGTLHSVEALQKWTLGSSAEGLLLVEESLRLLRGCALRGIDLARSEIALALIQRSHFYCSRGEFLIAEQSVREALQELAFVPYTGGEIRVDALIQLGTVLGSKATSLNDASGIVSQARNRAAESGLLTRLAQANIAGAKLLLVQGNDVSARQTVAESLALADRIANPILSVDVRLAAADLLVLGGHPLSRSARHEATVLLDKVIEEAPAFGLAWTQAHCLFAEIGLSLRDWASALQHASAVEAGAQNLRSDRVAVCSLRQRALSEAGRGNQPMGKRLILDCLGLAQRSVPPFTLALCYHAAGRITGDVKYSEKAREMGFDTARFI